MCLESEVKVSWMLDRATLTEVHSREVDPTGINMEQDSVPGVALEEHKISQETEQFLW